MTRKFSRFRDREEICPQLCHPAVHYAEMLTKLEKEGKHVFTKDDTQCCVLLDSCRRLAPVEPTSACSESLWFDHRCRARRHRRRSPRGTDRPDQPGPGHRGSSKITNEVGIYLFSALPGATYTLTADLPGFKKYTQKDVKLFVNDRLGLPPIVLEVGTTAESVTVEAQSVQLQTVSAERSGIVTGRQMVDIALNGRNFTSLLRTVPGAPA